jgi:thiol:disulfide interchange protein DsbD
VCVLVLRASGHAVGWGFQLQEPWFVAAVAVLLVTFATNLFGAFEISFAPDRLARVGSDAQGAARSFFDGLLAVVLATPCSAPFLGTAVGFAFASSAPVCVAIFASIGLGLAAPFVTSRSRPGSGAACAGGTWMLELRRGLAFALLLTVVWLSDHGPPERRRRRRRPQRPAAVRRRRLLALRAGARARTLGPGVLVGAIAAIVLVGVGRIS